MFPRPMVMPRSACHHLPSAASLQGAADWEQKQLDPTLPDKFMGDQRYGAALLRLALAVTPDGPFIPPKYVQDYTAGFGKQQVPFKIL